MHFITNSINIKDTSFNQRTNTLFSNTLFPLFYTLVKILNYKIMCVELFYLLNTDLVTVFIDLMFVKSKTNNSIKALTHTQFDAVKL